jgi:lipopolysaccharide/colanic/teichoic acid biosynthesis glycosyltransferase
MAVMPVTIREQAPLRRARTAQTITRESHLVAETNFLFAVGQERKRSERSGKPFLLILLSGKYAGGRGDSVASKVVSALGVATRDTDMAGWYEDQATIGIIFTEIAEGTSQAVQAILTRVTTALSKHLDPSELDDISITCHLYPEQTAAQGTVDVSVFYPGQTTDHPENRRVELGIKRGIDIIGSLAAILLFSPIYIVVAVLIKCTSKGPVLFRQTRVGQYGKKFTFLKFRSMRANNDATIHKEFITKFIAGNGEKQPDGEGAVFKLTNDPRVTAIGRFIRRTSLDELPQFLNVLMGEMSLVGPRPPLPYEFEVYDVWHRTRVFEVRPGITGLWQVNGRSKTNFDDMVRLDLQYARTWTIWMDLKILAKTPKAMLGGAY